MNFNVEITGTWGEPIAEIDDDFQFESTYF
jgi:hypothetical protein